MPAVPKSKTPETEPKAGAFRNLELPYNSIPKKVPYSEVDLVTKLALVVF